MVTNSLGPGIKVEVDSTVDVDKAVFGAAVVENFWASRSPSEVGMLQALKLTSNIAIRKLTALFLFITTPSKIPLTRFERYILPFYDHDCIASGGPPGVRLKRGEWF
jgi:hypothetical protein